MLQAVNSKIVCRRSEEIRKTESGIILTRDSNEEIIAQVISVGDDVKLIKAGDQLVIDWRTVIQCKHQGDDYYIVNDRDVLAVIR